MTSAIARRYQRFATAEARGHSPLYEAFALGVAEDPGILAFLATLPEPKQQPNLLFAALRFLCGTPDGWPAFRAAFNANVDAIRAEMMVRATQTNEPARCAVLLPALTRIPEPLALIEVGASAGLCLLPDRYGYRYDSYDPNSTDRYPSDYRQYEPFGGEPAFACRTTFTTPVPSAPPRVVWRAGLDLNPLDVRDADQMAWLETLVWPDQPDRLARLRAAIAVARTDPPRLERGDLLTDLPALAAAAPAGARLVVFHTAVLGYVTDPAARARFAGMVHDLGAVWISNEVPGVFPDIAAKTFVPRPRGAFLLAVDGRPVAWTDPHGAWIDWFAV